MGKGTETRRADGLLVGCPDLAFDTMIGIESGYHFTVICFASDSDDISFVLEGRDGSKTTFVVKEDAFFFKTLSLLLQI